MMIYIYIYIYIYISKYICDGKDDMLVSASGLLGTLKIVVLEIMGRIRFVYFLCSPKLITLIC